ncbi:MAG TPA: hypothetical protein VHT27_10800, partial [Solirubrobacteraceae bacterium]|nr:hypothetical protein [Solirubrobacteraceae bacterium]
MNAGRLAAGRRRIALGGAGVLACALLLMAFGAGLSHASGTATFGNTSVGGSSDSFAANRKRVSEYALPVAASVSKLSIYLAPTGTSGQQVLEGVIYEDASGKPAGLIATTSPLTFQSTNTAGWYDLPLPTPLNLPAGNYWLGVITGEHSSVAGFRYQTSTGARDYNTNTYTSGPSNPFGSPTTDSERASLYATYTPSSPPAVPANTALPAVSGTASVGQTLSATHGSWTENPTAYAYEWQRCNPLGEACATIAGQVSSTYPLGSADQGSTLRVSVTASNAAGSSVASTSIPTAVVQTAPATFGNTSVGGSSDSFAANRKRVSEYALPVAASVSKLSIYLAPTGT